MPALDRFRVDDLSAVCDGVRDAAAGARSIEEGAGCIVDWLHQAFTDAGGAPAFALTRLYKSFALADLDDDLQEAAADAGGSLAPATRCLTLLATRGVEAAWNDRHRSAHHRTIPLLSPAVVAGLPMVHGLLTQLGVDVEVVTTPGTRLVGGLHHRTYDVFFVPDARGSALIPAQDDFVIPYGIRSVIGFGGLLVSGDLFAVLGFSTVVVPPAVPPLFRTVSLAVKTALVPHTFQPLRAAERVLSPRPDRPS